MLNTKRYALAAMASLLVLVAGAAFASPSTAKNGSEMAEDAVGQMGKSEKVSRSVASDSNPIKRLADGMCFAIDNPSSNLRKDIFPIVMDYIEAHTTNKNPTKADAVKFLNANKHELICTTTGRNFMTSAIETRTATALLMRTFSLDIKDLKDENGEKVSIDFNGIYFDKDGNPQTLMNYIQNTMKSKRYTLETKIRFKEVAAHIYLEHGARRFHELTLTPEEKKRFPQKAVVAK